MRGLFCIIPDRLNAFTVSSLVYRALPAHEHILLKSEDGRIYVGQVSCLSGESEFAFPSARDIIKHVNASFISHNTYAFVLCLTDNIGIVIFILLLNQRQIAALSLSDIAHPHLGLFSE